MSHYVKIQIKRQPITGSQADQGLSFDSKTAEHGKKEPELEIFLHFNQFDLFKEK